MNPQDQAMAPKARIWRKKNEGLKFTSKGKKVGHGGKVTHFMVAISYNKGVIVCGLYEKMNGKYMESFVERNFDRLFEISVGDKERCILQDGDKSQNCANARKAWTEKLKLKCLVFCQEAQILILLRIFFALCRLNWKEKH